MEKQGNKKLRGLRHTVGDVMGKSPLIELEGNRRASIEGSRGVLLYSREEIKVNLGDFVVSLTGRGLDLKYISATSLIIEGFLKNIEFLV